MNQKSRLLVKAEQVKTEVQHGSKAILVANVDDVVHQKLQAILRPQRSPWHALL